MSETVSVPSRPFLLPEAIRACLFDLDGVLTDTASLHESAWKEMFDHYLRAHAERTGVSFRPFRAQDYDLYVDGRTRADGTRAFLASRGITLPEGEPDDSPELETVRGLGNHKNQLLLSRIRSGGVKVFDGSVALVHAVREERVATAVVSSSANTNEVLESTGLAQLFEVTVDGVMAEKEHLSGKPSPDTYLAAARLLAVEPSCAAVFEDALAGVEAGRAGNFGYVVGVDRVGQAEALRRRGADVVVNDLAELLKTRS